MRSAIRLAVITFAVSLGVACQKPIDLARAVQVLDVTTGWLDSGLVSGQNKLVPTVTFRLKNVSDQQLNVLQINAVFNRVTEESEWSSQFVTVAGSDGLAAGATSSLLTINAPLGYTGIEARQQMLANRQFVDAKVQLFAKYGSVQWTRLGEYPIARNLITK